MGRSRARADTYKVVRRIFLPGALVAAAVAAATMAVAGHGSGRAAGRPLGDPGAFVKKLVVQIVRDDYAHAWQTLHPAHQRVASKWEYVDCELGSPIPGQLVSVKIVRVFDERVFVPGLSRVVESKAVTFRLTIKAPALGATSRATHTGHAVPVDGRWRWILPPDRFEVYRSNLCLGAGPRS